MKIQAKYFAGLVIFFVGVLALQAAQKETVGLNKNATETIFKDTTGLETAVLAGGCFWKMDACYQQLKGVKSVEVGYAGGSVKNPSYEQVGTRMTGHAETVKVVFDPKIVTYRDILDIYWHIHDPTKINQEGNDIGNDYRSAIFHKSEAQKNTAMAVKDSFLRIGVYPVITTAVEPYKNFYRAEEYHQNYYNLHPDEPYTYNVVRHKVEIFQSLYKDKIATAKSKMP